jgi:hypothetical protein
MSGEGFRKALKEEWGCQGVGREHLSVDPQVCFPVGSMQSLSVESSRFIHSFSVESRYICTDTSSDSWTSWMHSS